MHNKGRNQKMKFCSHCGKEIMEKAVICPGCGCQIEESEADRANPGLIVLSILIPIVGIIMSIVSWNKTPHAAKTYLKTALITISVRVIFWILLYAAVFGTMMGFIFH